MAPQETYIVPLFGLFVLVACGSPPPPTQAEVDDAVARVEAGMESVDQIRTALELLGILPTYTCGEPRRSFVGKAVEGARREYGCVTFNTEAVGDAQDSVVANYGAGTCTVRDYPVTGSSVFRYSGGEDRFDLEADFRQTKVDGVAIQAKAGYGECSDEKRYWALGEGKLPKRPQISFKVPAVSSASWRDCPVCRPRRSSAWRPARARCASWSTVWRR